MHEEEFDVVEARVAGLHHSDSGFAHAENILLLLNRLEPDLGYEQAVRTIDARITAGQDIGKEAPCN